MPQAFYEPRQSHHHGDDRLAQLAALAQIYGGINGQANQQGQNQQQNALAVLGLMMQHQHQQDLLGVQKSGQEQNNNQFMAQQTQAQAELGAKNTWEQQKLEAEKSAQQDALTRAGLNNYVSIPGATLEGYSKLAEAANVPGFAPFNAANHEAILGNNVSQLQQLLGPTYGQFDKQPHQAQKALDTIWQGDPRMQNPEVQARLQPYLDQQNASIYKPQATADAPAGTGIGGGLGSLVHNLPGAVPQALQSADSAMTDFGGNFWANLLGLKPSPVNPNQQIKPWGPFSK